MSDVVLLDTDVFSFLGKAGNNTGALYQKHVAGKTIALSFVTVGELLLWPKARNWGPQKIADLQRRISLAQIIPYDMLLCETYADLKDKVTKAGSPVPDNDLWIASTAVRHSIPLVTPNRRNFDDIPDLVLVCEAPKILKGQVKIGEDGT
ncbi:MAG: PIN domain-containing protein [Candidatus Sulfotelmatobacter sp.]